MSTPDIVRLEDLMEIAKTLPHVTWSQTMRMVLPSSLSDPNVYDMWGMATIIVEARPYRNAMGLASYRWVYDGRIDLGEGRRPT